MAELIDIRLRRAALALANTFDYARAAESLNVSKIELRAQIKLLEDRLCIRLFMTDTEKPVLTSKTTAIR
jgi:DNA-binding transcriptional LysR family regulator